MNKFAICTIAIDVGWRWFQIGETLFRRYSRQTNSDLIVITEPSFSSYGGPALEKFQLYDLLIRYERVLYVDADILINPTSQDLFEMVPPHLIGAVYDNLENVRIIDYSEPCYTNYKREIQEIQQQLGNIDWEHGYINTGVLLLSQVHKEIFSNPQDNLRYTSIWQEQTLLNYNIQRLGFSYYILPSEYNATIMTGFTSGETNIVHPQCPGQNKGTAKFLHFAGEPNREIMMGVYRQILGVQL